MTIRNIYESPLFYVFKIEEAVVVLAESCINSGELEDPVYDNDDDWVM